MPEETRHIEIGPGGDPGALKIEKGYDWPDFKRKTSWIRENDLRWQWVFGTEDINQAKLGFWNLQKEAPNFAAKVRRLSQVNVLRLPADKLHEELEKAQADLLDVIADHDEPVAVHYFEGTAEKPGLRGRMEELLEAREDHDREAAHIKGSVEREQGGSEDVLKQILEKQQEVIKAQMLAVEAQEKAAQAQVETVKKILEQAAQVPSESRAESVREQLVRNIAPETKSDYESIGRLLNEKQSELSGETDPERQKILEAEIADLAERAGDAYKKMEDAINESMVQFGGSMGEGGMYAGFGDFKFDKESGENLEEQEWTWFNEYLDKLEDQGGKFDYTLMYPVYRFLGRKAKEDYNDYKRYNFLLGSRKALHEVKESFGSETTMERWFAVAYYAEMSAFDTIFGITKNKDSGDYVVASAFRELERLSRIANEELDSPKFLHKLNAEFRSRGALAGNQKDDGSQRTPEDLVSVVSPAYAKGKDLSDLLKEIDTKVGFRGAGRMAYALYTITCRKDLLNRRASIKWGKDPTEGSKGTAKWYREKETDMPGTPDRYKLDASNEPGNFVRKIFWRKDWLRNTGGGIGVPYVWQYLEFASADFWTAKAGDLDLVSPDKATGLNGTQLKVVRGINGGLGPNKNAIIYTLENTKIENIKFAKSGEHTLGAAAKDWKDSDAAANALLASGFINAPDADRLVKVLDGGAFNYVGREAKLKIVKKLIEGVIQIHTNGQATKMYRLVYWNNDAIKNAIDVLRVYLPYEVARELKSKYIKASREIVSGAPLQYPTKEEIAARATAGAVDLGISAAKGALSWGLSLLFGGGGKK